jgi:hypothetical protein
VDAADQAALAGRGVLDEEGGGTAPFAARRETLHQPAQHEQNGRGNADRAIGRHEAGQRGCRGHQADGQDQRLLAPPAIAVGADDDGADRAHHEADAVGGEGGQHPGQLIGLGKEVGRDLGSEQAEDQEVEQLDEIADRAGDDRPPADAGILCDACAKPHGGLRHPFPPIFFF